MKFVRFGLYIILAASLAACTSPVSPAGSVTITTGAALAPANGAQIPNLSQPVTLAVSNAFVAGTGGSVNYTFEVASDPAFGSKILTRDVAQQANQTAVTLDVLPAGKDYYWRVRATSGTTVGTFTDATRFTIGPAIVIGVPVPVSPTSGAIFNIWPTFTVTNATKSGPVGTLQYRFDISTNASFSSLVNSGTVPEGVNQTSYTPSGLAAPSSTTQYFWRVTVTDPGSGISGASTNAVSFQFDPATSQAGKLAAQLGVVLWPGIQPPGTTGKAVLGDNWQVQSLVSVNGIRFQSPMVEWLRVFDLMDRGMDPQSAIDWMHNNGYQTTAAWFPSVNVLGFQFTYAALIGGKWDLVLRLE
jgi:hypothetical protein